MIDIIAAILFVAVLIGFFVYLFRPVRSSDVPREVSEVKPAAAPVCTAGCWDCPTAAYGNQTPEAIPNRRELSQPVRIDVPQDAPIEWSAFVRERAGK
jgi:hypothetical protein